ncbi:MAG: phosphatidate cytidylyltransferase [Rhodocyclaceae bacterium]|nr:phosphatidate cytidylyltransferase [Rhodocyclaceae bacterium]
MLKTRVLTAALILAAFLPSLFYFPQRYWAWLAALIAGVAAWEWGGLIRFSGKGRAFYGVLVAAACIASSMAVPAAIGDGVPAEPAAPGVLAIYGLAAIFWGGVVPFWLRLKWQLADARLGAVVGLAVIVPAWLALVQLRLLGSGMLLAILAVVWIADIAAYFAGKTFGRHKLAPSISPGKTWEGAAGATVGVLTYGLLARHFLAVDGVSAAFWVLGLLLVTVVSVVGDLFESLLKRQAGLKDSSHILPGHGGVLDRIDSLTSTLPTVALLWLIFAPRLP